MSLNGIFHVPRWLHIPNSLLLHALQILPIGSRNTPKFNKRKGKKSKEKNK